MFPRDGDIEAWLIDTVDIPSGPESEDEEEQDEVDNSIIGNYIIGEDGVLIQNIDYLDEAQEVIPSVEELDAPSEPMQIEEEPLLVELFDQADLPLENEPVPIAMQHVQRTIEPVPTAVEQIPVPSLVIVDDENDQPLGGRLYEGTVEWLDGYIKPNICYNFEEQVGPRVETESPIDAFSALFPDDFIDVLVYQTNLYATQKGGGAALRNPTDKKETKAFLGINIPMGIKGLPSY